MEKDILDLLEDRGMEFMLPGEITSMYSLTADQARRWIEDPDGVWAEIHGVSLERCLLWNEWIDRVLTDGGRCYGKTVAGHRCKRYVGDEAIYVNGWIPERWSESLYFCSMHQDQVGTIDELEDRWLNED